MTLGDMASNTITTTRQINFDTDAGVARQRMLQAVAQRKGKVVEDQETIVAKFGSQLLMRLVGGWFVSSSTLPVKATISFTPLEAGTLVRIAVGDAMGVGVKTGMNDKFTTAVNEIADVLAAA